MAITIGGLPAEMGGYLELRAHTPIKVWNDPHKGAGNLLIPNGEEPNLKYYKRWPVGSLPGTMWVEGKSSSGFLSGGNGLRLWYTPSDDYPWYPGAAQYNPDTVNVTIVQVDMDMYGVSDAEEESVGGYIPLGGVKKVDLWRVQPEGFANPPGTPPSGVPVDSAHPLTLDVEYSGRGSGLIEIWDNAEMTGSPLSLPITYTDALTLPDDVWVKGTSLSSSLKRITLVAQYSIGGRTVQDRIKLTVYELDYVRLWDHNKIPNRTTRAIDADLRVIKEYEDNPRSDTDLGNPVPMLVVAGSDYDMASADIKLKCQFLPSDLGQYVLWQTEGTHSSWVSEPTSGNFATSNPANIHLNLPSTGDWREHKGKDVVVKVGFDSNMDGILQQSEEFPGIEWGIRAINKIEYDYCNGKAVWWLLNGGWVVLPDACELLEIFLDRDDVPVYSGTWDCILPFDYHRYEQKNGLGTSGTSLTQALVTNYIWDSDTGLWSRVFEESEFWDTVIQPCLEKMDIVDWYDAHPGENSHTFSEVEVYEGNNATFSESWNLSIAIGGYDFSVTCTVDTVRGELYPEITRLETAGQIKDLYDWPTAVNDDYAGWIGRIQTAFDSGFGRTAGQVFRLDVILDTDEVIPPQKYDDYGNIRSMWLMALGVW